MYCINCGKEIDDDAKFCWCCGRKVDETVDISTEYIPEYMRETVDISNKNMYGEKERECHISKSRKKEI